MIKLKSILNEGYAWERKEGKGLPTLAEVQAEYEAGHTGGSYEAMTDSQLIDATHDAGAEEMIIYGADGDLENRQELIDLLNAEDNVRESSGAKPDYIDADGDGNEKESMRKAFADKGDSSFSEYSVDALTDMKINLSRFDGNEDQIAKINREIAKRKKNESINELSDDEIDARWNKPQQNWQRQFNSSQMDIDKKSYDMPKSAGAGVSKFYQEKIAALKAERQQLEFDMEQEAEPEGGPIADYYGEALEIIDNQISAVQSKMNTNESINEGFISRIKKNLIGAELRK
jgi:hypothetical protein